MRIFKKHPLHSLVVGYLEVSPKPSFLDIFQLTPTLLFWWLNAIYFVMIIGQFGHTIGNTHLLTTGHTLCSRIVLLVVLVYGLVLYILYSLDNLSARYVLTSKPIQVAIFIFTWSIIMNEAPLNIGLVNWLYLRCLIMFWFLNTFHYCVFKRSMSPLNFIISFCILLVFSAVSIYFIVPFALLYTDFEWITQLCDKLNVPSRLNMASSSNLTVTLDFKPRCVDVSDNSKVSSSIWTYLFGKGKIELLPLDFKPRCVDVSYNSKVSSSIWTDLFGKGPISKESLILNSKKSALILTYDNINTFKNTLSQIHIIPHLTGDLEHKEYIWYVYLSSKAHLLATLEQVKLAQELFMTPYPTHLDLNTPSYLEHLFLAEESLEYNSVTLLEKACAYIDNPSKDITEYAEQRDAYITRKNRYIGQVLCSNWKGYPVDFTLDSNVIPIIKDDLQTNIISCFGHTNKLLSIDPYYNYTPLSASRDIYHPFSYHPCFMLNVNHNEIVLKQRMGNIFDRDYTFTAWLLETDLSFFNLIPKFSQRQIQGYIWSRLLQMSTWPVEQSHVD